MSRFLIGSSNPYVTNLGVKDVLPSKSSSLGGALTNITSVLIIIIGLLSTVFIIVGAFQLVASAGSPQRVKQARETIIYACVGVAISIAAYAIVNEISSAFKG